MNLRHPVNSLSFAMMHALEVGLDGVPSEEATRALGASHAGPRLRRPLARECEVVMFSQSWRGRDIGFEKGDGNEVHDGETVVVMGPQGDACVYFASQPVHHLRRPNRRFFLDLAAHGLEGVGRSAAYEGRDDPDIESMDYAVEADIARLLAALRDDPARARQVAGLLREYAQRFADAAARTPARSGACGGPVAAPA